MSARPMIIAVWMRAAAPGWRPMASTAAATARPWPRPHRPDAIAMPRPAAMTVNGPTQPPVPSAANAHPGTPRTAMPVRISERRTNASPVTCGVLVVLGFMSLRLMSFDRSRDVQHGEHHEDERLQERHQNLERIDEAHDERRHHGAAHAPHDRPGGAAVKRPPEQPVQP